MLIKTVVRAENYLAILSILSFAFLTFYWHDGIQNLAYWEDKTGLDYKILMMAAGILVILSFIISKLLRKKGTIHQNTLFFYSSIITVTTIALIVVCLQTPFIAPQWQTSILPPPSYDNWNSHMMLMSVLFLALVFFIPFMLFIHFSG